VTALAREVEKAAPEALAETCGSLRGLLRDYRDKARNYIDQLREKLSSTAQGLERLVDSMSQYDGDHESRLREALKSVRELSCDPAAAPIAHLLRGIGDTIDQAMEQFRQQQQLAISQFLGEISQLHERIDALELEAAKNGLTKVIDRAEMENRLRRMQTGGSLLLLNPQGMKLAAVQFSSDVAQQLAAAFAKRLRNNITPEAMLGRWSEEEFLVLHPAAKSEALAAAKQLTQALSGAYPCQQGGKTVRPSLQVGVVVLDFAPDGQIERTLQRIDQFFKG
jgi:GGDEF domain-containing protein